MMPIDARNNDGNGPTIGLLLSGGLDSAVLLQFLLDRGDRVQPIYIDFGLFWQRDELRALRRYLCEVAEHRVAPLVTLELPVTDIYERHWSVTGRDVPGASADDEAVFLPGRNVLLVVKAALWCQEHGIEELALAVLKSSPFADTTARFFEHLERALNLALSSRVRILRPFSRFEKRQVMEFGRDLPLELTFSCIAPVRGLHCGVCNKCAERQAAIRLVGREDLTEYAHSPAALVAH